MKRPAVLFLSLILFLGFFRPLFAADEEVTINRSEPRIKAQIAPPDAGEERERSNPVFEAFGWLARGAYYGAKTAVDALGNGTDRTVEAVQDASYKSYQWISTRFRK